MVELELKQELVAQSKRILRMRAPYQIAVGGGVIGTGLTSLLYQLLLNPELNVWGVVLPVLMAFSGASLIYLGLLGLKQDRDSRD
jgi:Na+/H+ antiporter NhaA